MGRSANLSVGELLGGEERIDKTIFDKANDGLVANFGKDEYRDVSRSLYHVFS